MFWMHPLSWRFSTQKKGSQTISVENPGKRTLCFHLLSELIQHAQLLDAYYIPTRYPNGFAEGKPADYFNEHKAREAVLTSICPSG